MTTLNQKRLKNDKGIFKIQETIRGDRWDCLTFQRGQLSLNLTEATV